MTKTDKIVEMYWDIGSTNTYFALKLIKPVLERTGAKLVLHPFNLGHVFRSNNYVLMDEPPAKLANRKRDLARWAEKHGLPFRLPSQFPIKTSRVLRGAIAMRRWDLEMAYIEAVFEAYWERDDASIAEYAGLRPIAKKLGVDPDEFEAASESAEVRQQLVEATNHGLERGVFGVPSIFVGDELFWGKDRMEFVEHELMRAQAAPRIPDGEDANREQEAVACSLGIKTDRPSQEADTRHFTRRRGTADIDFYTAPTPNGRKVAIFLEESGLDYTLVPVDTTRGDQFDSHYLEINPNNKIPSIVDHAPPWRGGSFAVFESGAILLYLARKYGKFLPSNPADREVAIQWLMWQMGGFGPMLGQAHHFRLYAKQPIPYCIDRYTQEAQRLYRVLDRRLAGREYLANEYSIADMATWPWVVHRKSQGIDLADFPNVQRWNDAIKVRPGVRRGFDLLREQVNQSPISGKAWETLFGSDQFRQRPDTSSAP